MRLATFNVESLGSARGGMPALGERVAILRPQIERLDADILCLQEVDGQHVAGRKERELGALAELFAGTAYASYALAAAGGTGDGVADVHNLVVASRLPIVKVAEIRHSLIDAPLYRRATAQPPDTAPQPVAWDRPLLHVELALPDGRTLHIVNLHLRAARAAPVPGQKQGAHAWKSVGGWAEGFFIAAMKRLGQAAELRRLAERILDADRNALLAVAGDFNAEDHEAPLRLAIGSEDDTGNGALAARMLVPVDRSLPEDRRYSVAHHGRPLMLDHILVSRPLLAHLRKVEVHNETLLDELIGPARTARAPDSFHAPLVAHFAL